ncbi:upstream stimulatory factor 2 isoform X2 [Esox lucius]|uniref:upstream stimulatory factor 2 isoform X2 n=1 Tax=Esox lucius TaxID=8010 RepID=UPI0014776FB2|nr:upstream stimulatory factor 2 isoform X2 [Esox lucius]
MDMLEQSLDSSTSHEKQETEEVLQLEEEQTAVTITSVPQAAAFADHNVQYQFRTENSGGQVTYRVVQVTDDQLEAAGDGTGAVSVVSTAAFTGTQQAVAQAVIQNPFSNGGSPAGETVGGETRFAYFPAATVSDGTATAVSVQSDPTLTQAGGQFYVMMSSPDMLQAGTPRTIAPRTHNYTTDLGENEMLHHGSSNWKIDGPRAPRDERRRAQHNEGAIQVRGSKAAQTMMRPPPCFTFGMMFGVVERRRRDKINNWIVTLSKIIPDCNIDSTKTGAKSYAVSSLQSKGGILSKACDYIRELRQNNQRLQDSFKEVVRVQADNELLKQQIEELKNDNALLRAQLQQHGIEINGDTTAQ